MIDSTHTTHGIEINLEITTAGPEDIDINDLSEEQARAFQKSVIEYLSSMSHKKFFAEACNHFESYASKASGWILARQLNSGEIVVSPSKGVWEPVEKAIQSPDQYTLKSSKIKSKGIHLSGEEFWLSREELMGNTPVFLVEAGLSGVNVNIGSFLIASDIWELGDIIDDPSFYAERALEAVEEAGNPSKEGYTDLVYEEGLQFEIEDLRKFLEEYLPHRVNEINWPENPSP